MLLVLSMRSILRCTDPRTSSSQMPMYACINIAHGVFISLEFHFNVGHGGKLLNWHKILHNTPPWIISVPSDAYCNPQYFRSLCSVFHRFRSILSPERNFFTRQINQPDATVSQVYYSMFMCGSTCFGRPYAHHQELTTALAASGFTVRAWR
jgi:hypothetical protein